ncbi:hypothetical protein GF386_00935 [Candidatus Pacearchaeota archaeon]|nr:hypothetical protein [Candidatus Pacearchaeota archaeon]
MFYIVRNNNVLKEENSNYSNKKVERMVLFPFNRREKNKQRVWGSVLSLGGLLLVAVGVLTVNITPIFLEINIITLIGIVSFLIGIVYLTDTLD